ncbi:MAG: fibronectin type III domain-containing protein [Chloroflexi bacterium]|nr:fibronectin type III domain-containing protein [Chloroflexota bacterium]
MSGDTTETFTFTAVQDTVDDDDESVRLAFGTLPPRVSAASPSQAVVSIADDDVPAVTVSFGQSAYQVAEGSDVTVTVTLSADPERTVEVPITLTDMDGATSADYSGVPPRLTFNAGDTTETFNFSATDDAVDDDGERVRLTFGILPTRVTSVSPSQTVVSITDDDDPAVTVRFGQASYSVAEGGDVTVTVALSADPERTVVIPLTTTNLGGASSGDYSGVPATVTFTSGETEETFDFAAIQDAVDDDGESVKVGFGSTLPAGVTVDTSIPPGDTQARDTATVAITDDDGAGVTVTPTALTIPEGSDRTYSVKLDSQPTSTVTVAVNAPSGSDVSVNQTSLTFTASTWSQAQTVTVSAAQDADAVDDRESITHTAASGDGDYGGISVRAVAVRVTDDEDVPVTVGFAQPTYAVAEGNDVTVTVTLSADPERTVEIPLTVTNQGGATSADYDGVPATVTFDSGDTEQTFAFTAKQDTVDDDGESVKVAIGATLPTAVSAGATAATTVAITDDDVPAVSVSFGQATYPVAEGNDVTVTVTLSVDPERTVAIPLVTANQGGASNLDYSGVPTEVTFNSGETEQTFMLSATDDTVDDDGESVKLTFGNLPARVSAGARSAATVTISDDDHPAVSVSFGAAAYTVAEGDDVMVLVRLSADPERDVEISVLRLNQGGAGSADYSGVPTSLTFASGETAQTITFSATADDVDDDGESVKLTLGSLPHRVSAGAHRSTTVAINDDDVPAVSVSFGQASYSAPEGSHVTVTVRLSADPERTVEIPLTTTEQGGATSADYVGGLSSVTFSSGETEKEFNFSAVQDAVDDDGESVRLGFGNLPARVSAGAPATATVMIADDDDPSVTVSFGQASYSVAESDETSTTSVAEHEVEVTVSLSADPERQVVIPLTTTNQGGASTGDYSGVPANLTFASGEPSKSFTFSATADTVDDDGESVKLGFGGSLPAGVSVGTPATTTVSIADDDHPAVTVSFGQSSYSATEGGDVTVTVTLSADPERTVEVPITVTDMDGATSADYSGVPARVTFVTGDTTETFEFRAEQDAIDDDGERVRLTFGTLPPRVSSASPSQAVVSITDDDDPTVTVSFGQARYTVAESDDPSTTNATENEFEVTVSLSANPERQVVIPLTTTHQGGASSSDYSGVPANLTFTSGVTAKSFAFRATPDAVDDDGESVILGFGGLPPRVSAGAPATTTVSIADDDDPPVSVSFGQASYSVAESDDPDTTNATENEIEVTVSLSADPERQVLIPLTTANLGGASASDYSGVPTSLTFASGETSKSFTFSATADAVDDDGESLRLTFGTLPPRVTAAAPSQAVVSITDDDDPAVTVSFGQPTYTVGEGNTVTVIVTLSADPERTVEIPLLKVNQGGATSGDYSGVPTSVTFNSGETTETIAFSALQDSVDDDRESVRLTLGNLPARVSAGTHTAATVAITDDDDPAVTVMFGAATYPVAEGGEVTVTVRLSADPERTVEIPLTTTNQGAASNADYSGVPAEVTFTSGETEQTFTFSATSDSVDDDGESVKLGFGGSLPTGVSAGTPATAMVAITDDDDPVVTVSFGQASYSVAEGDDLTVTVTLSADPERTVEIPVSVTTMDGATAADYSGVPASVTFQSGDTTETFTFTALQDTVDDDGESVKLGFGGSLPAGVSAAAPDATTVTIADDDDPAVTVSFGQASYSATEGGTATVTVTLSADPERTVEVPITVTNMDGATAADYSGVPASVTFQSGDTTETFEFRATQDTVDDDGESVRLTFGTLPSRVTSTSPSQAAVSITDDDDPAVAVSFGAATYPVAEGGEVTVTVRLSADPERTVEIPLTTTNQGAASNADYSGVPAEVTFTTGETEQTFKFSAAADDVDDDGESVKLSFGVSLPTGVSAGTPDATTISIMDNDDPVVTVSFGQSSYSVAESDDTSTSNVTENEVVVTVRLSADPERTVEIPLTVTHEGGASTGDYSGVPAEVTFPSGETEQTFTFSATADSVDDDGESVKLGFGNLPTGVSAAIPVATTVAIADDDDPAVSVRFGQVAYTVPEGAGVTVRVTLSADPERTVEIPLTATNQGGASNADYSGVPAGVTFQSGETEKTFTFDAESDSANDDGESVKLSFGNLPTRVSAGTPSSTTVTITDDDVPVVAVSFGQASYSVAESDETGTTSVMENEVVVTVELSVDPERQVVIPLTKTNQGGATSSDYSGVPAEVTFTSGETEQTFTFSATADNVDDDGESVKLGFGGSLPTGVNAGATHEAVVSIADDDDPTVTVSFDASTYSVAEGGEVTVTVELSADPERTVEVPITVTTLDGATAADYSGVPASLTFQSGDTTETFEFRAEQDAIDDDGERVRLTFGTLPARVSSASPSQAVVAIADDDDPTVTVSFGAATYAVAEGDDVTVTLTLSADPERQVVIPLTRTNQDGASNADYSGVPAEVTFTSGQVEQTFTFSATTDNVDDDGESVKLGFGGSLPTGVSAGTPNEAVVSIADDDDPAVTVSFGQASYSVAEGGEVTVSVTLSADPERTVEVPLLRVNQGGATSADYSGVPASVTFQSGDTEQTFAFRAESDSANDDGESVKLSFGTLPARVTSAAPSQAVVTISDDDVPAVTVSFGAATYTVAEGGDVTVAVTLSADPERQVVIPLTKANQGGATSGDYSGVPANVTFSSGETAQTFEFRAASDSANDDGESVKLSFGNLPTGVSAGATDEAVVSITDDDVPAVTVSFGAAAYTVDEYDDPSTTNVAEDEVEVRVVLSADPEREVVIPLTRTNQDGATDSDYTGVPASLTFASGDTAKTLTFTAVDDSEDDDSESVKLGFGGSLPTGVSAGAQATTTVTITDDDREAITDPNDRPGLIKEIPYPEGSVLVTFDAERYSATEGGLDAIVTVRLDSSREEPVEVPLTAEGHSGATPDDWTGVPPVLTFGAWETQKSFTLVAVDDTVEDDGEMVRLGFGALPEGYVAAHPSSADVTLMNDDTDQPATCDSGIWCAVLKLADSSNDDFGRLHLGYHGTQDPYADRSSISSDHFTFRGETFKVWSVHTWPNIDPSLDPRPIFGTPERSRFSIHIRRVDGPSWAAEVKRDHYEDWTLHIDDVTVRFTEVDGQNGNTFVWLSEEFYQLFMDWMPSTTHQIWIEETPLEDQPVPTSTVPAEPRYLRVAPFDNQLVASWNEPRSDGNSAITGYRLQWKPGAESWTNANAVSEAIVEEWTPGATQIHHLIGGLTNGSVYTVRVMAINAVGDSAPSGEHFGMPQSAGPQLVGNTVSGAELTLTYDRDLDESSVPDVSRFAVIVNGGLRDVIHVSISGRSFTLFLASPVTAADEVEMRYLMPATAGEPAIRDTDGNYAASCDFSEPGSESENLTDPAGLQPLTAQFEQVPETHTGSDDELRFHIRFSEPIRIDAGPASAFLLTVTGADVTSAWWVNRDGRLWEVVLVPDSYDDILITLPADRACDARGAPCASGDRRLTNSLEQTITGEGAPSEGRSVSPNRQGQGSGKQSKSTTSVGKSEEPSVGKSVEPPASPPQAPRNLTASVNADGSIALSWDAPVDSSVTGYRILRRRPSEGETALQIYVEDTGSTATTYTDTATTVDVRHVYRVKAIGKSGVSEASDRAEATPTAPATNSPASGVPQITGTAEVGQTLSVDTTGIADADGLTNATFSYQWILGDADIEGATGATYVLADADAGATITVRVTFADDAGHSESLTSAATAEVAARPNRSATGAPTITGTAQVGQTLTADTSGITDADGLANATFSFQWIRGDADIDGATRATYELADADAGATIKVRVTFTDDAGHAESLTSAATAEVAARPNRPATGAPTISGTTEIGQTLTADTSGIADADGLANATFSYQWIRGDADIDGATGATYELQDGDAGKAIRVRVTFTDDAGHSESLTSAATAEVAARPNRTATGAPTVSGTTEVGQTLTADTSGIADADGLANATFSYQWIRGDADIDGATGATYELQDGDAGKAIRVRVTFTDDAGHSESLTSAATAEVAAAPSEPLTVAFESVPETHDGESTFTFEIRFNQEVKLSFRSLRDHGLDVTGGTVTKAQRLEKPSNIRWRITVRPDSGADVTIVLPVTTDCDDPGAICTADGIMLSSRRETMVRGPEE